MKSCLAHSIVPFFSQSHNFANQPGIVGPQEIAQDTHPGMRFLRCHPRLELQDGP